MTEPVRALEAEKAPDPAAWEADLRAGHETLAPDEPTDPFQQAGR